MQTLAQPQHPRIPTDSSSQQHFGKCIKATTSTDSYGFQLPAAFWKVYQSHNIHGFLRIPAPSSILQALAQPQHPRIPTDSSSQHDFAISSTATTSTDSTDSSSQQHFGKCNKATRSTDAYGFQLPAAFWKVYQSHTIHGFLRIPAPSTILETVSKPQHPRIPTDSSSQHDFVSSNTATSSTESYGFQLPAAFCKH